MKLKACLILSLLMLVTGYCNAAQKDLKQKTTQLLSNPKLLQELPNKNYQELLAIKTEYEGLYIGTAQCFLLFTDEKDIYSAALIGHEKILKACDQELEKKRSSAAQQQ